MKAAVIIPFRDRGKDPLRQVNLTRVIRLWDVYRRNDDIPYWVVSDLGKKDDQFNRSRAYNIAWQGVDADVFVFTESDMLIPPDQIRQAIDLAREAPGLVIPFTQYRGLSPEDSELVRESKKIPPDCTPITVMNKDSTGAINVVSRKTLELTGGYDENFTGSWWDDTAMFRAFRFLAGEPRWVEGPAYHLYHLPAHTGEHLTDEDRAATRRNNERWERYKATEDPEEIKALVTEGR